jgi:TRAP-type mannitol/chloroaromatic compound transport system permease small subunit
MNKKEGLAPHPFCDGLDGFIRGIGHVVMWSNVVLIFVIILQVILRYGFGYGQVILEEFQWHLYALGIMIGSSYAEMMNTQIRVDIVYARLSEKWRYRWDLFGTVFLLLPFLIIIFYQSLDFVYEAIKVNERSDAPLGLPWRWAVKSLIPISFGLLVVATVSRSFRIFESLRSLKRG